MSKTDQHEADKSTDNTNADVQARAYWIRLAQDFGIPIRCIRFTAPARLCEHNDAVRALNVDTVIQKYLIEGRALPVVQMLIIFR
jgi:predicted kinase